MAQLTIQPIGLDGQVLDTAIAVPYAPTELAFTKASTYAEIAIPGLELPLLQFVKGESETLTLELFLDSTSGGTGTGAVAVTPEVDRLRRLLAVRSSSHAPALVRVGWGADFPGDVLGEAVTSAGTFTAVVLSVTRRYTLFSPDGKPLRAVVSVALKRYATLTEQLAALNLKSADHTRVHVVAEGETLPLIAHDAYSDPGLWRVIADHNRLRDVRDLRPGTRLEIPPLVAS